MTPVTLELPDELAEQIKPVAERQPQILALGLCELNASSQPGIQGTSEVLEFLTGLPTPEDILALQPAIRCT